ncbi:hypothetical protein NUW58_g1209 [Xylaria curta]|uniref:Uncharacterized protein n=1 Tax=Xylaria curta TaxID=42375 RepID=A0ACC1PL72_9PEZI|nr:hypothetical protein NUW58_g1209 [Xylaria curta]
MLTLKVMKLFAFLSMSSAVLAIPESPTSKSSGMAPFAPATAYQRAFDRCSTEKHHKAVMAHPADILDCLEIGEWAKKNNGMWILDALTDANDDNNWHTLRVQGTCALIVQNTKPTSVGNKDVVDLIEAVHMGDGIELGPIEERGTFGGCQGDADVSFWLRDSEL